MSENLTLRGFRVLMGEEARLFSEATNRLRQRFLAEGYSEVVLPAVMPRTLFENRAPDSPLLDQMFSFEDKGGRNVVLAPEYTAFVAELYRRELARRLPKPVRLFYVARCYRYERPQAGRYREFTQVGLELLGPDVDASEVTGVLKRALDDFGLDYRFVPSVKRGLTYYVEDGFEVEVDSLGAQKQVAGGGRYAEGVGFAVGLDRLVLALQRQKV